MDSRALPEKRQRPFRFRPTPLLHRHRNFGDPGSASAELGQRGAGPDGEVRLALLLPHGVQRQDAGSRGGEARLLLLILIPL